MEALAFRIEGGFDQALLDKGDDDRPTLEPTLPQGGIAIELDVARAISLRGVPLIERNPFPVAVQGVGDVDWSVAVFQRSKELLSAFVHCDRGHSPTALDTHVGYFGLVPGPFRKEASVVAVRVRVRVGSASSLITTPFQIW